MGNIVSSPLVQRVRKFQDVARAILLARASGFHRSPPVLADIGARGGLSKKWDIMHRFGLVTPVLFEPDPEEAIRLRARLTRSIIIESALGSHAGIAQLNITSTPGCSSLLEPDLDSMEKFGRRSDFEIVRRVSISVLRMDSLSDRFPPPDFLKVDVQGAEMDVLLGAGELLSDVLCIELETQLVPHYKGQALFHEIYAFLKQKGFGLCGFRPLSLSNDEIIEGNAFFSRRSDDTAKAKRIRFWRTLMGIPSSIEYSTLTS